VNLRRSVALQRGPPSCPVIPKVLTSGARAILRTSLGPLHLHNSQFNRELFARNLENSTTSSSWIRRGSWSIGGNL